MYITQEADYAVRIVHALAKDGIRKDARSISNEVDVTLRFSLKILGKLSKAGVVNSFKGNKGGYELAADPQELTLRDVITVVDGPIVFSRCLGDDNCNRGAEGECVFRPVYRQIGESINAQLDDVSFAQLCAKEMELTN